MASLRKIPGCQNWIACYTDQNGKRRQRSTGMTKRQDAQKIADEYEAVSRGKRTVSQVHSVLAELTKEMTGEGLPSFTVREYITQFMERKAPRVSEATLVKYQGAADSLLRGLGEKSNAQLASISTTHLHDWQKKELERIRPGTLQLYTRLVRQLFKQAQAEGLRPDNPSAMLAPLKKEMAVRKAFAVDQVQQLLREADGEWPSLILFATYTGQRLGDLAKLSWDNVDIESRLITLRTIKTGKELHIPIAEPLRRYLLEHTPAKKRHGPVHPTANTKSVVKLSAEFSRLLVVAKIREPTKKNKGPGSRAAKRTRNPYTFHCFRHTAVSMMKSAGVSEAVVMDLIGHESAAVSRGYTHLDLESKKSALAVLPDITRAQSEKS